MSLEGVQFVHLPAMSECTNLQLVVCCPGRRTWDIVEHQMVHLRLSQLAMDPCTITNEACFETHLLDVCFRCFAVESFKQ